MSITSANAVVQISIPLLFPIPQQLQQFAADDVFDTDPIQSAETQMGVDGVLAAGFVFVEVKQNYALMANSPSTFIFDTWWSAQQQLHDVFPANAVVLLPAIRRKWTMTNGFLTTFPPTPNAKKLLQPRKFTITWESVFPSPQ